ncbi:phosphoadenosine phosphosulfate reductase family protein [Brevibacillus sp. NPDC058079]|uniref:phosphoadenosine phosphosulfate reductase domain-containing protein n=1 Tax=Brevibacillus sp. NPDC058079 TaxID=3346330 RepID=UPI0036E9CC9D
MTIAMEKPELDFIEPIIEQLVEAYLDTSNKFPWFIGFSNGKDSSTLGYCVWKAVERIPTNLRERKVYFATSDTLLEHPHMRELMEFSYQNMNEVAKETGLPIEAFLVKPKMTAVMKMIAHGNPLPTPKSSLNRWCTDLLKLRPMEELQDKIIKEHGSLILMVGVRSDESKKRASSIKRHSIMGEFIFPKIGAKETSGGFYERYMSHPIVDLNDEEVWRSITYARILPWKTKATTIRKMYEGAGECPIQVDKQSSKPCGGSSRNGCMICMMTTAQDDKMLQAFMDKGEEWAVHMNRLRRFIRESLFDARFRRPINSWRKKKLDWANPFIHNYAQKVIEWKEAKGRKASREAFENTFLSEQGEFEKMSEGLCHDSKPVYPNLSLAGYTLQARILLLKAFLYTQEVSGVKLVSEEELSYVKKVWTEECGWIENEQDLMPEFPDYRGSLVLNPDYTVNVEDTTIPNLTLYGAIVDDKTGYGMIIPPIENKKLTPPPRKRSKMTKAEELAMMTIPTPKTINLNPDIKERQEAFYIMTDWGYDEATIVAQLEQAALKTGIHLPYYWLPAWNVEKRFDWSQLEDRDYVVYWNTVVFIVCDPDIHTREEALKLVDWYMEQAVETQVLKEANWDDYYVKTYGHYPPMIAKREMLKNGEDPEMIPSALKLYAHVSDKELMTARVMRYYGGNPLLVSEYLSGELWETVSELLVHEMKPHEAKLFLLNRAYLPHVLPKHVKEYAEIGDNNLEKANTLRYRDGLTGRDFWYNFHLAYLVKGMSPEEVALFLVKHDYDLTSIPKVVQRLVCLDLSLLSLAQSLKTLGMPIEQIETALGRIKNRVEPKEEDLKEESRYIQLELEVGA